VFAVFCVAIPSYILIFHFGLLHATEIRPNEFEKEIRAELAFQSQPVRVFLDVKRIFDIYKDGKSSMIYLGI